MSRFWDEFATLWFGYLYVIAIAPVTALAVLVVFAAVPGVVVVVCVTLWVLALAIGIVLPWMESR